MIDIRTFDTSTPDDAGFRTLIATVHDALETIGMIQATDAGQIDPATAVRPAVSTDAGVEYWHLPGNPAQLKGANGEPYITVSYGVHSNQNTGRVRFRVAYGSIASPALSASSAVLSGPPMTLASILSYTMYSQADESGLRIGWSCTSTTQGGCIAIEKPKDAFGVVTEEPILLNLLAGQGSSGQIQLLEKNVLAGSVRTLIEAGVANLGTSVGSTNGATDLALEPMAITYRGKWFFGSMLFGAFGDLNGAGLFDFDWLGYEEFRALPTFSVLSSGGSTACLPWE